VELTKGPLVSGYDDMADGALAIRDELEQGTGKAAETTVTVSTATGPKIYDLIDCRAPCQPVTPATRQPWTADALRTALLGERHEVIYLGGHFDQGRALAADETTLMLSPELASSNVNLIGATIFGQGCHLGYNTIDLEKAPLTIQPDWAQAAARKGVVAFLGGTGYQYFGVREPGDLEPVIEFGERLYLDFAKNLRAMPLASRDPLATGHNTIGHALVDAKRSFVPLNLDGVNLAGIGEKQLMETTLFGIPHVRLQTTNKTNVPGETSIVTDTLALGPQSADVTLPFDLDDLGGYLSGPDGTTARPFAPVLPLSIDNVSVPNKQLVGVGFLGGQYTDTPNVTPTLRLAATETGASADGSFSTRVFWPQRLATVDHYTALTGGPTQLLVTPAQFRSSSAGSSSGTEREYHSLSFRLFYLDQGASPKKLPVSVGGVNTTVTGAGVDLQFTVNVTGTASEVWITYTLASGGEWRSFQLDPPTASTPGVWTMTKSFVELGAGSPADVIFMVQAANADGIVTMEANGGAYFSGQPLVASISAPLRTTRLALTVAPAPPSALACSSGATQPCGRYQDQRTFSALLEQRVGGDWQPLSGERVLFTLGRQTAQATTAIDGKATVTMVLQQGADCVVGGIPHQPCTYPLAASFTGEDSVTHLSSGSVPATFTIEKAPTSLTLAATSPMTYGSVWAASATLKRTPANVPIADETVFLKAVAIGGTATFAAVGTTNSQGIAHFAGSPLPVGTYSFQAYYGQEVTLPGGGSVDGTSAVYGPSATLSSTLTVVAAPLTIKANDATRMFGAANPTFTGTITGVAPGDNITATYTTTATPTSPLGVYDIVPTPVDPGGKIAAGNYTVTLVKGKLTVTPPAIAFTSTRDGNSEIYVMAADGSSQTRLTFDSGIDADPAFSPDGKKIAWTRTSGPNADIWIMDSDGTHQTRLTTSAKVDTLGTFSPDGTRIAFTSNRDGDPEIFVMKVDGSEQTQLTKNKALDGDPAYSPVIAGMPPTIAITSTRDNTTDIYLISATPGTADAPLVKRLTNDRAIDTLGTVMPDGKVVFTSNRSGNFDLWMINADGSGLTQLTNNAASDLTPQWAPDGAILFSSNRDGKFDIYRRNADLTVTRLTTNPADDTLPATWQP
jgi:Tol biopolymer transport system component